MKLRLKCPCGARMVADASAAGKRGRCKQCNQSFRIPAPPQATFLGGVNTAEGDVMDWLTECSSETAARPAGDFTRDQSLRPRNSEPMSAPIERAPVKPPTPKHTCPDCSNPLSPDAVLCFHCGYHTRQKRKVAQMDAASIQSVKKRITTWGVIGCGLAAAFSYFTVDAISNPAFQVLFFAGFCVAAVAIPWLRSSFRDTDRYQLMALSILEVLGAVRIVQQMVVGDFRFGALLLGMLLVPYAFLFTTTETHSGESWRFRNSNGGLSLAAYALVVVPTTLLLGAFLCLPDWSAVVSERFLLMFGIWVGVGFAWMCLLSPREVMDVADVVLGPGRAVRPRIGMGFLDSLDGGCDHGYGSGW